MTADRELLLEIGCEELPASWLPSLTVQVGDVVAAQLAAHRLVLEAPADTFSTPRRLTVRVAKVPERQTDLEELITGPPVSAAFRPDGTPTPAGVGFAAKQGVDVGALERVRTPKGEYLAFKNQQRGRAAVDVLPDVLRASLRALSFPKLMRWDALIDDGRGDLMFGRPIRWILYLYGGRVVPFTIARAPGASSTQVQDIRTGAATYGHRFLTTSGRAGRAIKVRSFEEYRGRLLENFVVLEREERHNKIVRELDAKAQRLGGRVSRLVHGEGSLLNEVPDLVEYPSVVAGTFDPELLALPEEVLATTLVHHQHYFPVEGADGRLKNAFLAVINTEPDNEGHIARNAGRVVTARLRDAQFFWEADRTSPLESRIERLRTLTFHKKLGTYQQKAERMAVLASWIAEHACGAGAETVRYARMAARLAKADLATDMVREFTELQGAMGGIYAREEGQPEAVWKAIYHHYLPVAVEADAAPAPSDLGQGAVTWAAVSLADKLDTLVGLFASGEKPTGSRDPFGLRRAAQGVVRTLVDLPVLAGVQTPVNLRVLVERAFEGYGGALAPAGDDWMTALGEFIAERELHVLEKRGLRVEECRAVLGRAWYPADMLRRAQAVAEARTSREFEELAELFKRVKNISKGIEWPSGGWAALSTYGERESGDAAEQRLIQEASSRAAGIHAAEAEGRYVDALSDIARLQPFVAQYFVDVLVMSENRAVREKRLQLMAGLRNMVLEIADISEIAST